MHILLANFTKMVNDSGGLAKVTCAFANEMIKRGHKVSLLYSDEKEGDFFYPIDGSAALYNLKKKENGSIIKVPFYVKALREILRCIGKRPARTVNSWFEEHNLVINLQYYLNKINPDIIVSYQPAASKLLLCDVQTKIPVITMSHGDPEDYFHIYPVKEIPALEKSAVCQVLMPSFEDLAGFLLLYPRRWRTSRIYSASPCIQHISATHLLSAVMHSPLRLFFETAAHSDSQL